jgi:eukaryotic-like serine/threonine-protein kinase
MSDPVDPLRTTTAPAAHDSAASDADMTAAATSRSIPSAPQFGPPAESGEVGTLGPYRVVKELGKGGMGAVYLATDTRLNRKLALKVMLPEFAADAAAKERFLREARAVAQITQDNVVTVYEADERDGVPYIAMQFLQGYPLDDFLKKKGSPALHHCVRIVIEAARGLEAAHKLGLVHRDIKPANLWLEAPNGRVKVLDFGLAKPIGTDSELTKSGAVVGTPAYMSPEQARGLKVDHRTDLFSLGGVLYRLCTGQNPFAGDHVMAVLAAVLTDDPTPVRELNPNVPEPLAQFIHQLLAKKPEDRPQSANEVARSLRAILEQRPAPGAPSSAEVSTSMPVVVVPAESQQPPVVVPMEVTARPESAFEVLDDEFDDGATEAEAAPAPRTQKAGAKNKNKHAPRPKRKAGGKGTLIAAGVALLLVVVAVAVVVLRSGKKPEPEAKNPDAGAPVDQKGKGDTKVPKGPPDSKGPTVPQGPLTPTYKNGIGMEFVKVPKGTGWLGGKAGVPGETKVEFKEDFYLGKYEVTQEEWQAVMGTNPSAFKRGNEAVKDIPDAELKRFPVENVSWEDCQLFIKKLNEREKETGWVYRLPKEAEWEYACRGGPGDKLAGAFDFYFAKPTNTLLPDQANVTPAKGNGLQRTCKVGSYEPNLLGLHDMHGNILELCEHTTNGVMYQPGRGGSCSTHVENCSAALFGWFEPSIRVYYIGFRLARVPAVPVGKVSTVDPNPDVPKTHTNSLGMKFVPVPKGTGWLGGGSGKPGDTKVVIEQEFYLGNYEVTQEEWQAVMGSNPSHFSRTGPGKDAVKDIPDAELKRFPVENVSWNDCQEFIKKLNEREKESGWVYRLPKEAEWEYACRGGSGDKLAGAFDFYFAKPTNTLLPEQANFNNVLKRTGKVGSYDPNWRGLYDMHGNVHEWCDDAEKGGGGATDRVRRGGHWSSGAEGCRAASRSQNPPSFRDHYLGLRLVRVPASK